MLWTETRRCRGGARVFTSSRNDTIQVAIIRIVTSSVIIAIRYYSRHVAVQGRENRALARRERVPQIPADLVKRAHTRLRRVLAARELTDLRSPPSLRVEAFAGDRKGTFSIRINRQWRVCFRWTDTAAVDIEVVDYH